MVGFRKNQQFLSAETSVDCFRYVYQLPGKYINDHCFIEDGNGTVHLFHIVGPVGKSSYSPGSEISFGHAVSRDLINWETLPDALEINPEIVCEKDHIYAPFVIRKGATYYMFYTGGNIDTRKESMCIATSDDLYKWEKLSINPVFKPSSSWAEYDIRSNLWNCSRDPHVPRLQDGSYALYYVTWIKDTNGMLTAIGAATSDDLITWKDSGPAMIRERALEYSTTSMESPCVVANNGVYYLFYKHRNETRLVVSDNPFYFTDKKDTWFSIAHAAEVFAFNNNWYISSCSRELDDLGHERSDRTKGLWLASLDWHTASPILSAFRTNRIKPSQGFET